MCRQGGQSKNFVKQRVNAVKIFAREKHTVKNPQYFDLKRLGKVFFVPLPLPYLSSIS